MKTIYVVFQDDLSDNPIICGIYTSEGEAKESIAAAKKYTLHRWYEMHNLQTKYDFTDDSYAQDE
jgi:hypothetical protein